MDHLTPRSLGGLWSLDNLAPAHYGCNAGRKNKPLPRPRRSRTW